MLIGINTSERMEINWGAVGSEEIAQNVFTLINTLKYEVAYDRTLGIRSDYIDAPLQEAIALVTAQLYKVIGEREPRATVEDVEFIDISVEGNLIFKVVIDV
jgi:phage baseplate assembly protein W